MQQGSFVRQANYGIRYFGKVLFHSAILGLLFSGLANATTGAWRDSKTSIALGGYDPLSYFIDNKPVKGKPEYELYWKGVTWRFGNKGNRAAFESHPDYYAPAYAGYDSFALQKGRIAEGSPVVWIIHKRRLYLFQDYVFKKLWLENPEKYISKANQHWPKLSRQIPDWAISF